MEQKNSPAQICPIRTI